MVFLEFQFKLLQHQAVLERKLNEVIEMVHGLRESRVNDTIPQRQERTVLIKQCKTIAELDELNQRAEDVEIFNDMVSLIIIIP